MSPSSLVRLSHVGNGINRRGIERPCRDNATSSSVGQYRRTVTPAMRRRQ